MLFVLQAKAVDLEVDQGLKHLFWVYCSLFQDVQGGRCFWASGQELC